MVMVIAWSNVVRPKPYIYIYIKKLVSGVNNHTDTETIVKDPFINNH